MFYHLLVIGSLQWASAVSSPVAVQHAKFHPMRESFAADPNIVRLPHEVSCHLFYHKLSEEDISIKKCPDDELFDYLKNRCVEKDSARCWNRLVEHTNNESAHIYFQKSEDLSKCPNPFGNFPDRADCTRYYYCLGGKAQSKTCDYNQHFDKIDRKCMDKIKATCVDHTDVIEPGYKCPWVGWGPFPYSKDCSKYYECWDYRPDLRTCQKDHLFDERSKKCLQRTATHCGSRHNPYDHPTTQPISTTEKIPETSPPTTHIPKTSHEPLVTKGTSGEDFIVEKTDQTTVEPVVTEEFITTEKVTSEEIPSKTTAETKESTTENIPTTKQNKDCRSGDITCILDEDGDVLRCSSPDGLFPHPKDVHKFLHCSHNAIYVKECPKTLVFIESKQACSWQIS